MTDGTAMNGKRIIIPFLLKKQIVILVCANYGHMVKFSFIHKTYQSKSLQSCVYVPEPCFKLYINYVYSKEHSDQPGPLIL